jgi:hypothetical protein
MPAAVSGANVMSRFWDVHDSILFPLFNVTNLSVWKKTSVAEGTHWRASWPSCKNTKSANLRYARVAHVSLQRGLILLLTLISLESARSKHRKARHTMNEYTKSRTRAKTFMLVVTALFHSIYWKRSANTYQVYADTSQAARRHAVSLRTNQSLNLSLRLADLPNLHRSYGSTEWEWHRSKILPAYVRTSYVRIKISLRVVNQLGFAT